MKSSTKLPYSPDLETAVGVPPQDFLLGSGWEEVYPRLGIDLEQTARQSGALLRRRQIRSAADLLHVILFYSVNGWSLTLSAAWALLSGIGFLSAVALRQRLIHSRVWVGELVGQLLAQRCRALREVGEGRVRIIDASSISHTGSKGTDWRIHLSFDLSSLRIDGIEVTDQHGGESLARFPAQPDEICLADAGYAFGSGLGAVLDSGAWIVVRTTWRNPILYTSQGQRLEMIAWLHTLTGPVERAVLLQTPQGSFPLRLLAAPLPPEKVEAARRRVHRHANRQGKMVQAKTLVAVGFVLLLTNLPADRWPMARVLWLYRVRWQVELVIKRLKSLLHLGILPIKDQDLAQTYLLAKLLFALILEEMIHQVELQQSHWFLDLVRPISIWRLTAWFYERLRMIIFGNWLQKDLSQYLWVMKRYFCHTPRARPQQMAWARAFLEHFGVSAP